MHTSVVDCTFIKFFIGLKVRFCELIV